MGCTVIEKAATEKAVRDIDVKLAQPVADRQKAKAMGQTYYDAARVSGRFPNALPNLLRPQVCRAESMLDSPRTSNYRERAIVSRLLLKCINRSIGNPLDLHQDEHYMYQRFDNLTGVC